MDYDGCQGFDGTHGPTEMITGSMPSSWMLGERVAMFLGACFIIAFIGGYFYGIYWGVSTAIKRFIGLF